MVYGPRPQRSGSELREGFDLSYVPQTPGRVRTTVFH